LLRNLKKTRRPGFFKNCRAAEEEEEEEPSYPDTVSSISNPSTHLGMVTATHVTRNKNPNTV